MSHRKERFSSTLRQCLADILIKDMNDPLLKTVFISDVIVSPDLKKATVFVAASPLPGFGDDNDSHPESDPDQLIPRLTNAKGCIKRALAGRMYLKYIPELMFIKDVTSK
ncbi:MAG: 30S ribosome-binding factor RbfA [Candidatus Aminicenantes bacterium]|jgi:ribosome-binding factor A